jgi:hypothetical protein
MPDMTCETVADLARQYQPLLRFHKDERVFPVLAEAWLRHCSSEPWASASARLRGTALMLAGTGDLTFGQEEFVRAGCANTGIPLRNPVANERGNLPHQIGNPNYERPADGEDLFLDFGGWDDPIAFQTASPRYVEEVFSALAAAINPRVNEVPLTALTTTTFPPTFNVQQPRQPTMYAEVEWAGRYPRIDRDRPGAQKDFAHPADGPYRGLDSYVSLTYYFLYPAVRTPPTGNEGVRELEGQWEAVSVFLRGDQGGTTPSGRPRSFAGLEPRFVVYSQGYERTDGPNPRAECRPWNDATFPMAKDGNHPTAWVTAGTHRNLFEQRTGAAQAPAPDTGGVKTVAVNVGTPGYNDDVGNVGVALFVLGVIAAALGLLPLAALLMLLGLILAIAAIFVGDDDPAPVPEDAPREEAVPPGEETVTTSSDGPAAVPSGGAPSGTPPQSSRGTEFDLRVIDPWWPDIEGGLPPGGARCELPPWWSFGGRWGVKLGGPNTPRFDSGSRRSDRYGRSRGYWNARQLVQFTQANPSQRL